jgi:hypothetical protein
MKREGFLFNRRGQGTVENLMMTAIIAGLMIPIVYKYALSPLMTTLQGQRKNLVDFVAQTNKKPVPSAWFARERLAQLKETKDIESPKDIDSPPDIAPPGELSPPQGIQSPKQIQAKPIPPAKPIPAPKNIQSPSTPGSNGGRGGGAGGAGSALGGGADDPNFFGGGGGGDKTASGEDGTSGSGSKASGGRSGEFDEYAPGGTRRAESGALVKDQENKTKDATEASLDKKSKQNLQLSEAREQEAARQSPFDWWLLIKLLILGLIIFLVILIGLSNMKKR